MESCTDSEHPAQADDEDLERLIAAVRGGSSEALGQLLEGCRKYLLTVANRELPPELCAKVSPSDMVQETSLEACRGFSFFAGKTQRELLAWLRRILLHNLADATRHYQQTGKRQLNQEIPIADLGDSRGEIEFPVSGTSPSGFAMAEEAEARLIKAIDDLPKEYRDVVLFHNREDLPFVDIARRMDRSVDAVSQIWLRAIKQLRHALERFDGSESQA